MKVNAMYDQVLFKEEVNPFIKRKADSGLYIPEGMSFTNETGDMEQMDKIIGFGIVVAAGLDCKYVKVGDAIFYDRRSIRAVPAGEILWNMSEKGMVGYVKAEELDLEASRKAAEDEEEKMLAATRARVAAESKSSIDSLQALHAEREAAGQLNVSSPLIKIK